MNNLEAILFGLDGVIFDPEPLSNKKKMPAPDNDDARAGIPYLTR
jgi:hypothetical protein